MATAPAPVSIEEYLRTTDYESPGFEYIRGEIIPRKMPDLGHSAVQTDFCIPFGEIRRRVPLEMMIELHMRVADDQVRVADFAVYFEDLPNGDIPSNPPLVAVEVLSPGSEFSYTVRKFRDYDTWGVRYILMANPAAKELFVWDGRSLVGVDRVEIPEIDATLEASAVFRD